VTSRPSDRARLLALALVVATGLGVVAVGVYAVVSSRDNGPPMSARLRAVLDGMTDARPPFAGLTATRFAVGDDCLELVAADEPAERGRGLMEQEDLGPYDGMLFVSASPSSSPFVMRDTLVPLDIAWFDEDGRRVGEAQMEPCPEDVADCPGYPPGAPWHFALETLRGELPEGDLAPC
jgi:uncharacterized membrane protein (UPF0127 family)